MTANGQTTVTYPQDGAVTYKWTAVNSNGVSQGTFANDTAASTTWTAPTEVGTYTLKCALDDPWTGTQTGVVLPETGSKNDKAADGSAPMVRSVTVYVTEVKFAEDPQQKYGFDDQQYSFVGPDPRTSDEMPWKSVDVDQTDTAFAEISPTPAFPGVEFGSSDMTRFEVVPEPLKAASAKQKVPVKGFLGRSEDAHVEARPVGKVDLLPGSMNVAVFPVMKLRVGIALINRQGDDIQVINVGAGDVTKANQICITRGLNHHRDTRPKGDDTISGENITTGADGICQTKANENAVDIDRDAIKAFLTKVYKQAVIEWTVSPLPMRTVNFDQDGDYKLDVGTTQLTFMTAEQQIVRDAYTSAEKSGFHKIVFLMADPTLPGGQAYAGLAGINYDQPYAFVFADMIRPADPPAKVVAHEIGHALGLYHTPDSPAFNGQADDSLNVMSILAGSQYRLRKFQWSAINPGIPPLPPN